MRILLYSDVHISRTSSILPLYTDSLYTYRQKMIIDTAQWISQIAKNEKVDCIINLGDTFDQHTITSYDVDVASEFFKYFPSNIHHLVLVGNHEMINQHFNAISLLSNIDNITVISDPYSVDFNVNGKTVKLAFLPYCDYKQILKFPEGEFLFSHNDIQGSKIRGDFELSEGIDLNNLKQYKLVFNGHIHKNSVLKNVVNVGSVTTHSFSDDNETVPQCYIFNTETLNLEVFKNKACPLFRKIEVQSLEDLEQQIQNLDDYYKYVLNIVCPFEIKDTVKSYLTQQDKVLSYRLNVKVNKEIQQESNTENNKVIDLQTNINIKDKFLDFLDTIDLKYPIKTYKEVLNKVGVDKIK